MIRSLRTLLCAALVAATPLAAQQVAVAAPSAATAAFPETPAGRAAAALLETVRGGDSIAIRAFIAERMTGRIATEPWDRQLGLFRRMRNDFGGGRVVSATPTSDGIRVVIVAPDGRFTLNLGVEPQPPHRISAFGVQAVPGGDEGEAPAPAARPATPGAGAQETVRLPDTPAGRAAAALLETMRGGDSIAIRRFVAERMDAGFQSRPWDRQLGLFRRMRDDFGDGRIVGVLPSANGIRVVLVSPRGRFSMNLGVEQAPPYRINDFSVEVNPDGGDGGGASPGATSITAADQRAVIDSVGRMLERVYPSADTGRMIADRLRGRERSGAYASMTTAGAFATAVTEDMRAINGDRHLNLSAGGRRVRRGPPGDEEARAANYGMESRVMEGGIGYLRLDGLSGAPQAPARLGELLRDLGDIRAMIIDLRGAPGGSAEMANAVISHFTAPNLPSLRVVNRAEGTEEVRNTLAQVPGPRRLDIPLYVLVDRASGSAAEDVPFVLQNFRRATIVGETTAGAGRNNTIVPVGVGLSASISITRVSDARTGREWERVGVKPDIEAPSEDALEAALRAIRERGR